MSKKAPGKSHRYCRTTNVQANVKHKTMTHRCRECPRKPFFSLKTGTVMEGSKLGYRVWAIAIGRAGPPSIRTVIVSASHFQPEMKPRPERYDLEAGLSKTPAETEKDEQRRTSTGMSAFIASPYERTRPRRLGMPGRVPITAKG